MADRISHGVILVNRKGELLVIKRPFSYAVSSIFSLLLLRETTADRPDQAVSICRELLPESTPSELKTLKENWTPTGLSVLLSWYRKGLGLHQELILTADRIWKEFKNEALKVELIWGILVRSIKIEEIEANGQYRIHDFPKNRHCASWKGALSNFKLKTGIDPPPNLEYKREVDVSYTSVMGITYQLQLYIADSPNFIIKSNYITWLPRDELRVHEEIDRSLDL